MTDDRQNNEKFDAFLAREAAAYHRPPAETPREEMWSAIAQARATSRAASAGPRGAGSVLRDRGRSLRSAPWIGIAAALVAGVGIGRYALNLSEESRTPGASTPTVAAASSPAVALSPTPTIAPKSGAPMSDRTASVRPASRGASNPPAPVRSNGSTLSAGYRVASQEHLQRAEALVAVVAATPADAIMDSLMGRWARDVLSNTRLLLDSPAGEDPVRRRLLEDLETLLVQLVQRSGRATEERAMIDRTLQRTQLLTRLRSGASGT